MGITTLQPSDFANKVNGLEFPAGGLDFFIATATAVVLTAKVVQRPTVLRSARIKADTTGDSGQTDVDVKVNGAVQATLTIDNTDADGISKAVGLDVDLVPGDKVELEATAVAANHAGLSAGTQEVLRFDEP